MILCLINYILVILFFHENLIIFDKYTKFEAFEGLSYLANKIFKKLLVLCFIHIIQLSLFSNEYLPIEGKE